MPPLIEVTVSPQGETKIQTKGYEGPRCQEASKFLEQALGVTTGRPENQRVLRVSAGPTASLRVKWPLPGERYRTRRQAYRVTCVGVSLPTQQPLDRAWRMDVEFGLDQYATK